MVRINGPFASSLLAINKKQNVKQNETKERAKHLNTRMQNVQTPSETTGRAKQLETGETSSETKHLAKQNVRQNKVEGNIEQNETGNA